MVKLFWLPCPLRMEFAPVTNFLASAWFLNYEAQPSVGLGCRFTLII